MRVEDMWSLDGVLPCDIDESSDHISWQADYFINDESSKQKLTELLLASESHQNQSISYLQLSMRILDSLDSLVLTVDPKPQGHGVYQRLKSLVEDWVNVLDGMQDAVHRYILELINTQVKDYASIGHLMDLRHRYLAEYRKKKTSCEIRGLYGFLNHQSKAEVTRVIGGHFSILNKATTAVLKQALRLFQEFTERWDSVFVPEFSSS